MAIDVANLSITYRAPVRAAGLAAAVGSLFRRTHREIEAVQGISFMVETGEIVGFIGPNGAGKTSTLKMLSGILRPTGGSARVLDHHPWLRKPEYLRQIAMIRGSQPIGGPPELTVMDSLLLQQLVYEVPNGAFQRNVSELADMLALHPLLDRQIRALSLGERMRCGLALALVYRPRVLFLDEPTIGMDVSVVEMTRRFLLDYCAETHATVLLTSHYMADVERLCKRVILIDQGALAYDGDLASLSSRIAPFKIVKVSIADQGGIDWEHYGDVVSTSLDTVSLRVPREEIPMVARNLLADLAMLDLSIEEPPLESVIDRIYREGVA